MPTPSPPLSLCDGPASYSQQPTSSRLRAKFQGRRSYSEVSDPSAVHRPAARLMRDPVSTLPKPRPLLGESAGYGQSKPQLRTSLVGLVRPASAHGGGGDRGGGGGDRGGGGERGGGSSLSSSPHHCALDRGFPLAAEVRLWFYGFMSLDKVWSRDPHLWSLLSPLSSRFITSVASPIHWSPPHW